MQEQENKASEQIKTLQSRLEAIEEFMNELVRNETARKGLVVGIKQINLREKLRKLENL